MTAILERKIIRSMKFSEPAARLVRRARGVSKREGIEPQRLDELSNSEEILLLAVGGLDEGRSGTQKKVG